MKFDDLDDPLLDQKVKAQPAPRVGPPQIRRILYRGVDFKEG